MQNFCRRWLFNINAVSRHFSPIHNLVILTILLFVSSVELPGQATASLTGTLIDASEARVPHANVLVINNDTGAQWHEISNDQGHFIFSFLPPGSYRLRANTTGAAAEIPAIVMQVGDRLSITVPMKLTELNESVTVSEQVSLVQESPAVGTVINRKFLENLPLNGRSLQSLIFLTPGVTPVPADGTRLGQFSVNGQRDTTNYFTVDGVAANTGLSATTGLIGGSGYAPAFSSQGSTNSMVTVDSLQEFRIQTSTFAPEFGRTPGGQVSLITRSGTNAFHGSVFEYFRNEKLDANDWFANSIGSKRAALRHNQFGGVFGGPIIRNKTFFFGSYEGLRLRQPQVGTQLIVPGRSIRQTATGPLHDFVNAFPVPNGPDLADGTATFSAAYSNPSDADIWSLRMDHRFNDRWSLFGRYNDSDSTSGTRGRNGGASVIRTTGARLYNLTGGLTWIASPSITNEFRANWGRSRARSWQRQDEFGGAIPVPPSSSLFGSFASIDETEFSFRAGASQLSLGRSANMQQEQVNLVDTLSFAIGAHHVKFGGDYRLLMPTFDYAPYLEYTDFRNMANAISGNTNYIYLGRTAGPLHPRIFNLSLFAQDTWRATGRLTLTYGLRWEINPPPSERDDRGVPAVVNLNNFSNLALAPAGTSVYRTRYENIAPRAGFAYRFSDSPSFATVLRGGMGVFYHIASDQAFTAYDAFNYPFNASATLYGAHYPLPPDQRAPPPIELERDVYSNLSVFDPDLRSPYTLQWNLTVEQSLGQAQTLSVGYVAATGRRLYRSQNYPEPNPQFQNLRVTRSDADSDYHSLQLQFQRRLSKGIQALVSYTWAHSIDTLSNENLINLPGQRPSDDRASSDWDRRHVFTSAVSWDVPHKSDGVFSSLPFRNWGMDFTFRALSAAPIPIMIWQNSLYPPVRPNLVANQPLWLYSPTLPGGRQLNPEAFSGPAFNTQGNAPRNFVRGFPLSQLDLAMRRDFRVSEQLTLQFRAEAFNVLNTPNFADPEGTSYSYDFSPAYGISTRMLNRALGGLNQLYQIGGPRSIQLGLKLSF